jgi:hypothetical protein
MGPRAAASASATAGHAAVAGSARQASVRSRPAAARAQATGLARNSGVSTSSGIEYPPDTSGLTYRATTSISRPAYLSPITDPQSGQRITRITNTGGLRHRYSSKAVWNADQSLLMLDNAGRALLNGTTYASLLTGFSAGDYFAWDATVPSRGWSSNGGNAFRRMTITSSAISIAQTWTLSDYTSVDYGGGQGSPSTDGRYHAMAWRKSSGSVGVLVFDSTLGSVISEVALGSASSPSALIDSVCMSQAGDYVVVQFTAVGTGTTAGTWVYNRDLSTGTRRFLTNSTSHYDAGRLADGTDVLVMTEQRTGGYPGSGSFTVTGRWVMSSGVWAGTAATNYVFSHVSCRNTARWGWAYLSNYAASGTFPGKDEVVAVKLDGSDTVERFCHARSNAGESFYTLQTHACPSPDGARVIFASAWGTTSASDVYAFVTQAS